MRAKEFIKKFGWGEAKKTATKYTHIDSLSIPELKEYVNAWEMVQACGGINAVKQHLKDGNVCRFEEKPLMKKYAQLVESVMYELWAVNIPEEPDSVLLYPVPTQEIGEQLVSRLKEEALKQFPKVGQYIADSIYLEVWIGSEEDHVKYLKENKEWWLETTFLESINESN